MSVLYVIAALLMLCWGVKILRSNEKNKYLTLLTGFVVASMFAPVTDSLFVWAVELVLIIFVLFRITGFQNRLGDCRIFCLFVLWALVSLSYSDDPFRGIRGMATYVFPLFFYMLSVCAFKNKESIEFFFKRILGSTKFYALLGVFALFVGQFETIQVYYGMSICVIPLLICFISKKKINLIYLICCVLPAILLTKRTPLLGAFMAIATFTLLMFRLKAILPLLVSASVSVLLIVSIPQFREKLFFGGDDMSLSEVLKEDNMGENLNTNGRNVFWAYMLDEFYLRHPFVGAGTGAVKSFVQSDKNLFKDAFCLIHNDWLLVLCETGIVGVLLLLLFFISIFRKCKKYSSREYPKELRIISATCAGTMVSTVMHMFLENCMNSFVFSTFFVFYAIFNFYIRLYRQSVRIK